MEDIIKSTISLINKKNRIITISEVTHRSYSSHTFHYKLMKALHRSGKVKLFSSERLGILDVLLLNLWLENKLTYSLEYLYEHILPSGGLGTYRWLSYLKTQNLQSFKLIATDVDYKPNANDTKLLSLLKDITSNSFSKHLTFDGSIPDKKYVETNNDNLIRQALLQIDLESKEPNRRLSLWAQNIKKTLTEYPNEKVFINGFHLSRHGSGILKHIGIHKTQMLILGMSSISKDVPVVELTKTWLKKRDIVTTEHYGDDPKFWEEYMKFYDSLSPKKIKNILNTSIKNSLDIQTPTNFENIYKHRYALIKTGGLHSYYIDHGMGGMAIPYVKGIIRKIEKDFDVSDYDYVINIPHSNYRRDMRY